VAPAARADAFVYWANSRADTIGRANLDGTGVDQSFIAGASGTQGVAVDALEPPPTIADLIASVEALDLPGGIQNALLKKLTNAQRNLDAGDTGGRAKSSPRSSPRSGRRAARRSSATTPMS
jgi:hypothetical protein